MNDSMPKHLIQFLAFSASLHAWACSGEDAGAANSDASTDVPINSDAPARVDDAVVDGVQADARVDAGDEAPPSADVGNEAPSNADVGSDATPPFGPHGVLQYHNNLSRDGLYIDPALTKAAAARMHIDPNFHANIEGPIYTQPLYFDAGVSGRDLVFAATEQNLVYAFDATTGAQIWRTKLGDPVPRASLPCGRVDPVGVTGTPVIDAAARRMFVAPLTSPDGGATKKHLVFALSIDDGSVVAGWPVDVAAHFQDPATQFDSSVQNQRGALALVNGTLYVPFGGNGGDCGRYRGWVVAVATSDPSRVTGFATRSLKGGIWAPGGLASDGTSIFATTGNTVPEATWGGGEAVLRLQPGAVFSDQPSDYFAPSNWRSLDETDTDVGGTGPVLLDVPGATPSKLVVAIGKNSVLYLADRTNLGGIGRGDGTRGEGVASAKVSSTEIITAAAAYHTAQAAYVVTIGNGIGCPGPTGDLVALKIGATSPPDISIAWCAYQASNASPMVSTTDGHSEAVVWGIGTGSTNRLYGFDGDTGQTVFAGGGAGDAMSIVRGRATAIAAKGRIFVAAEAAVFAFTSE